MNDTGRIPLLTILLEGELHDSDIPLFRGAVLHSMGGEADVLFHNHRGNDGYRYSYPLIQYKRLHGQPAIVCIGEGVEAIGQFLSEKHLTLQIGEETCEFGVSKVLPTTCLIKTWNSQMPYRLRRWLPLNSENYERYKALECMADKTTLLEKILVGNILSMCKGLGITIEEQIALVVTDITRIGTQSYKCTRQLVFDVEFTTNISLPAYAGLGKNASVGFGIISRIIENNNTERNGK